MIKKKIVSICAVILVMILLAIIFYFPSVPVDKGVGQRILCLSKESLGSSEYWVWAYAMATTMGLPVDLVYTDVDPLPSLTDANGNGKYCLIFANCYGINYLSENEVATLDNYEQTFNVPEASVYAHSVSSARWGRYGIDTCPGQIKVRDITFTANNLRLDCSFKPRGNYTTVYNITLLDGCTVYAYCGNTTQDIPFLWAYTDQYGVIRVATSHVSAKPIGFRYWTWMTTLLALKLAPSNILFNVPFSLDIDDINAHHYGRAVYENETEYLVKFYENYSLPLMLAIEQVETNPPHLNDDWNDFFDVVRANPKAFDICLHPMLIYENGSKHDYAVLDEKWNSLNYLNLHPSYVYIPPGKHLCNGEAAKYLYENFGVRFVAKSSAQEPPSSWYDSYLSMWRPYRETCFFWSTDNITGYDWDSHEYCYSYASWCAMVTNMGIRDGLAKDCGNGIISRPHYQVLRNEIPIIKILKDLLFDIDIYKVVPTKTHYIAFNQRTFMGSYNITDPMYYPDGKKLTFRLVTKNIAPDDICGIIVPNRLARMDEAIFAEMGRDGVHLDSGAFLMFPYLSDSYTYTIYLDQEQPAPYLTVKNAITWQVWVSSSSYTDGELSSAIYLPPSGTVTNTTVEIETGTLGKPTYVLGLQYNLTNDFDDSENVLKLSDVRANEFTVGWGAHSKNQGLNRIIPE